MFTTPCFIRKNTPELIEKLEKLGYRNYGNPFQITDRNRIFTTLDAEYVPYNVRDVDDSWYDCGENEELFLALAAIRDDSDIFQWFTDGNKWFKCPVDSAPEYIVHSAEKYDWNTIHKATPDELINKFKTE